MQVLVHTDNNTEGREARLADVESEVESSLSRFDGHLTRVEVHLADESSGRSTPDDQRCTISASPAGQPPVAVTQHAETAEAALTGALQKLVSLLDSRFGRQSDRHHSDTIRDDKQP